MAARFWLALALVAAGALVTQLNLPAAALRGSRVEAAQAAGQNSSTLDDQVELSVTVYNSDLALIRDVRAIRLPNGVFDLKFQDIAATVNPATVHIRSLSAPGRVSVLEQNYEYDLLEPDKILRKYVGREVTLVRRREDGGAGPEEVRATLLSYNNAPVWQIDGQIVTGLHADHIQFPELPGNLFARPTLIWSLDNTGGAQHRIETTYLASKLTWNADYVLTIGRDDQSADLDGWVTVTNASGTAFRRASLQLVAGDLNRVRQVIANAAKAEGGPTASMRQALAQEAFSDYHLYTFGRKTTLNNNQTKQLSMLNATAFPIRKRYVVEGQALYYRNAQHPGSPLKDVVQVYYQFKNDERAGLGLPMPGGVVRVYQADSRGGTQLVGEDRIGHTPKDETINLKTGDAFDLVAERKQIDFSRIAANVYDVEYEVTLRNHKATPATVEVNEPIGGTWRMLQSTHEATRTDAWAAHFEVPVATDGETMLRYRVRVTY